MSKGCYLGISNLGKKVKTIDFGTLNLARKDKKGYIGKSEKAREFWAGADYSKLIAIDTNSNVWTSQNRGDTWTQYAVTGTSLLNVNNLGTLGYYEGYLYGAYMTTRYHAGDEWSGSWIENTLYVVKLNADNPTAWTQVYTGTISSEGGGIPFGDGAAGTTHSYYVPLNTTINQNTGDIYLVFSWKDNGWGSGSTANLYYICITQSSYTASLLVSAGYYTYLGSPVYDYGWVYSVVSDYNNPTLSAHGPAGYSYPTSYNIPNYLGTFLTGLPNTYGNRIVTGTASTATIRCTQPYTKQGINKIPNGVDTILGPDYYSGGSGPIFRCKYKNYLYEKNTIINLNSETGYAGNIGDSNYSKSLPLDDRVILGNSYSYDGITFTSKQYPANNFNYAFMCAKVNGGGYVYW